MALLYNLCLVVYNSFLVVIKWICLQLSLQVVANSILACIEDIILANSCLACTFDNIFANSRLARIFDNILQVAQVDKLCKLPTCTPKYPAAGSCIFPPKWRGRDLEKPHESPEKLHHFRQPAFCPFHPIAACGSRYFAATTGMDRTRPRGA